MAAEDRLPSNAVTASVVTLLAVLRLPVKLWMPTANTEVQLMRECLVQACMIVSLGAMHKHPYCERTAVSDQLLLSCVPSRTSINTTSCKSQ